MTAQRLPPPILSIQSWVAYGHVGNAAATLPLQRLGFEVWGIQTVQFSNHTGYGQWTGQVLAPEHIGELIDGIAARGVLGECAAVLSGYMGSAGTVSEVLRAVQRVRALHPQALYCCDPVMGDYGRGVFVRPELPPMIAGQALREADILTPNQFELELLSGQTVRTLKDAREAAQKLRGQMRPGGAVLVTSLQREEATPEQIETLAVTEAGAWLCATPLLPLDPPRNGTGDAIAALFLGHYLRSGRVDTALSLATSALYALLNITHQAGSREIQLVAAQDEYAAPQEVFAAHPIT